MNRDEFEKWAKPRYFSMTVEDDGDYADLVTASAWEAWQACSRLYAKLTAEPTPGAMTLPGDFFSKGK